MDHLSDETPAISADLWRAWAERDKRREKASARKTRIIAGIALVILFSIAFYALSVRRQLPASMCVLPQFRQFAFFTGNV